MTFFTADTHFHHRNILAYCNRPFATVDDMNEALIANWNGRVTPKDTVYHLGDFGMGKTDVLVDILARLRGKIVIIPGSHDRTIITPRARLLIEERNKGRVRVSVDRIHELKIGPHLLILCHYALMTWPKSHYKSWLLFGHSHGKLPHPGLAHDVGVDCNNYAPVSMDEVTEIMEKKAASKISENQRD